MGLFDTKHSDELKLWLVKELEPICDADPEVLSDYVLALLKHDASEGDIEKMLAEQLDDFLGESTASFVKKALDALRNSTYLPESKRPVESAAPSRKRSAEDEGRRSPPKSSRPAEGSSPQDQHNSAAGPSSLGHHERGSGSPGPRDYQNRNRRPKDPCRDYHLKGFCPRGNECRWDHSPQAGAQLAAANGFPVMGQMPGFAAGQPGMGRGQQAFMARPPFAGQGPVPPQFIGMPPQGWGAAPQGSPPEGVPPYVPHQQPLTNGAPGDASSLALRMGAQQPDPQVHEQNGAGGFPQTSGHPGFRGGMRGGARGGRGGAGGGRGGGFGTFGSQARSSTTLVIENVPQDSLDLIKINDYFKKFGTITNIQIDAPSAKALVSYSQPSEAKTAHSSPDVIFGNRFVKVYFQKLDEGTNGAGGSPSLKPSVVAPPPKSNFIPGKTSNVYHAKPPVAASTASAEDHTKALEAQKAAQAKLDGLMAEQKEVMTKVTSGTAEEKKQGMARFKALDGEVKLAAEEVRKAVKEVQSTSAAAAGQGPDSGKWKEQREAKERQRLDRELEMHSKGGNGNGTTEELKATLARLQAEAASMGIDPASPSAPTLSGGAYRGRGRGRGAYSSYRGGRGGPPGRMSLDNRTTKLRISDLPAESEEQRNKAQEWFKQFGEVAEFSQDGFEGEPNDVLVVYKVRANAEAALRSGLSIPDVGQVKASWYTAPTATNSATAITAAGGAATASTAEEETEAGHDDDDGYDGGEGDEDKDDHFRR